MIAEATPRQQEVLDKIEELKNARGFPPTIRELMVALERYSTATIACNLRLLREKGLVTWEPRTSRTLRVVKP